VSSIATDFFIDVVQALSRAREMSALQWIVSAAARRLTGTDGTHVILREGDHCCYADEDAVAPTWNGRHVPLDECIGGWVMKNRKPALIVDVAKDPRIPADAYRSPQVRSLAMLPIRSTDPIGAMGNYWSHLHQPTDAELRLLQALADTTAVAMESVRLLTHLEERVRERTRELEEANAEIRQLSLVDELTGLSNRRGFFLLSEQARRAAVRQHLQVFLLFVDADGLKKVNDTLGHEAGDAMLRSLGQVLKSTFRRSDVVARLGGDEFCVFGVHKGGDPTAAKHRLNARMAAFNASHAEPYQLAASAGVFAFAADDACLLEDVVARADKEMYAEKRARKSRVECAR
jgi:diguanylate cyclase (GGDEF)-like protein